MLKVGIVGLGTIAFIHKACIDDSEFAKLTAVCDTNTDTQKEYPDLPFYTDLKEMLEQEELDVVHVCLPHHLHVPAAELILKHDVSVLLEKPAAISYEQGQCLIEAEKNSQGKLGICFQNRYNNTSRALKKILEDPEQPYGEIIGIKGIVTWFRPESYYQAKPWRGIESQAGGGTIINQAIHTLDLMRHLTNLEVVDLKASLSNLLDYDIEVEDTAVAQMTFEGDVGGFYMATNAHVVNSPIEVQVLTKHARFTIRGTELWQRYPLNNEKYELIAEDEVWHHTKSYYGRGHKLCIDSFYEAVINDTDDYVRIADALKTNDIIDMMKESSENNQRVKAKER